MKCLALLLLLISNYCYSQKENILSFRLLTRRNHEAIVEFTGRLKVSEFTGDLYHLAFTDSQGVIKFNVEELKRDSGKLYLIVAIDTLMTFTVYKAIKYGYEITIYVDNEAINNRFREAEKLHRRRKKH